MKITVIRPWCDAPATTESLRTFILQRRNARNTNRDLVRGICFGHWEMALGAQTIIDAFAELWPKHKLKIRAADIVLLRNMNIAL